MNKNGKKQHNNVLKSLILFVRVSIQQISDFLQLAALEARLALKTLVLMAILVFVLSSVLTALWVSIQVALFFVLVSFHFSLLSASLMMVGVNMAALVGILYLFVRMI